MSKFTSHRLRNSKLIFNTMLQIKLFLRSLSLVEKYLTSVTEADSKAIKKLMRSIATTKTNIMCSASLKSISSCTSEIESLVLV